MLHRCALMRSVSVATLSRTVQASVDTLLRSEGYSRLCEDSGNRLNIGVTLAAKRGVATVFAALIIFFVSVPFVIFFLFYFLFCFSLNKDIILCPVLFCNIYFQLFSGRPKSTQNKGVSRKKQKSVTIGNASLRDTGILLRCCSVCVERRPACQRHSLVDCACLDNIHAETFHRLEE